MKKEGKIINVGMSNHINFETAFKLVDSERLDEVLLASSVSRRRRDSSSS